MPRRKTRSRRLAEGVGRHSPDPAIARSEALPFARRSPAPERCSIECRRRRRKHPHACVNIRRVRSGEHPLAPQPVSRMKVEAAAGPRQVTLQVLRTRCMATAMHRILGVAQQESLLASLRPTRLGVAVLVAVLHRRVSRNRADWATSGSKEQWLLSGNHHGATRVRGIETADRIQRYFPFPAFLCPWDSAAPVAIGANSAWEIS